MVGVGVRSDGQRRRKRDEREVKEEVAPMNERRMSRLLGKLLSILENVSAMGAPVPDFVQSLLQKLKGHTEHTMEGEEERND